jgi:hypothetical protein
LFEVTAEGEVVWEYVNPYVGCPVFRAYHYPLDRVAKMIGAD